MDVAVVKNKDGFVAFSIFPVGAIGWGKSKKEAIDSINDNIYDYCNWLFKPLPKSPDATAVEEYSGDVASLKFKSDDKSIAKKYAEVVVQTAFSFKCMLDSFELSDSEKELVSGAYISLGIADGGVIGYASALGETCNLPKCRAFIYNVYKTAKELFFKALERGESPTDCFKFNV